MQSSVSRRTLLAGGAFLAGRALAADQPPARKLKATIFSKHLQFLQGDSLATAAAEVGFDGIDITVRKGGHIAPERVRQDLPPLVAVIRRHGLEVPMITAEIVDAETPQAEEILEVMNGLGIRFYRWGGFTYNDKEPFPAQLERLKARSAKLAAMNARHHVCAMYHTHSGREVGAPIWDLYVMLKGLDPNAVGINYDIGHATIEGGLGGWIDSFRMTQSQVRGIAVKDFVWGRDARGEWQPQWVPLGEGMVRFPQFLSLVAESGFDGPLQVHFEYKLGPENDQVYAAMRRDLGRLRSYLAKAGL